jgi:hypothetical protein
LLGLDLWQVSNSICTHHWLELSSGGSWCISARLPHSCVSFRILETLCLLPSLQDWVKGDSPETPQS